MKKNVGIVFINSTADTFTPTISGALSTWIWEVCQAALRDGSAPLVISRSAREPAWPWGPKVLVDYPYPRLLGIRGFGRLYGLQRRVMGWEHKHFGPYARQIIAAINAAGADGGPFFLQNDLELVVLLRRAFPNARILHLAQNNMRCARRFRQAFTRSVDLAIAVTDFCACWNSGYYGIPVRTLYSGINSDVFRPAELAPSGPPIISFHGRTSRVKGLDLLFEAAIRLAKRRIQFGIQAIGASHWDHTEIDGYQKSLTAQVAKLERLGVPVRRPGHVDRMRLAGELQKAQIHCVPARWDEPFGLTTLEGMACGLATVASRTGGTPEIAGDACLLFERENVEQLAGHLERLITDENLRRQYALMARKRAEEFTWDRTWRQIKTMLAEDRGLPGTQGRLETGDSAGLIQ